MPEHFEFTWWMVALMANAAVWRVLETIDWCRIDKRKVYEEGLFQEFDELNWRREIESFNKKLEERKK